MDVVKMWVDYWTRYKPEKPWIEKVTYGLWALRDRGRIEDRLENVVFWALETYHRLEG